MNENNNNSDQNVISRRTPLYDLHRELGAKMVSFSGWEMPVQYSGLVSEHEAVRHHAGLFDVCHMGELLLTGQYAEHVVNYLITNDVVPLQAGQALYTCCCNEEGMVLDDLIVYKLASERFLIVCNASNRSKISRVFADAAQDHCEFRDLSDETSLIALQGPKAFHVVAKTGSDATSLSSLKPFHFRDAVVANIRCTVARTGYTGEDGMEIFCKNEDVSKLFSALLSIGKEDKLIPCGLGARDTLRLEAKLSLYGNEIDETINPIEAGLSWVVKFEKELFVGKQALTRIKSSPLKRKMVGFEMIGRGIARHGYPLRNAEGKEIGLCTSGSPSPSTGKNIGLGYLPLNLSTVGSPFFVDCRGKYIEAKVVPTPFYKRVSKS